jgi:hypothetical protein
MGQVRFERLLSQPDSPVVDTIYAIKNGAGFDWYLCAAAGVLTPMNAPAASAPSRNMGSWTLPNFDSSRYPVSKWQPSANLATVPGVSGLGTFTAITAGVARAITTTNAMTRRRRIGYPTSAATAGLLAGARSPNAFCSLGASPVGGFLFTMESGCADAATVAGARQFCGLSSNTAAPTNVEPSTLLNCIGIGHGAADTNLKVFYGGSAAQAAVDLGVNFPRSTLSTDMYKLTVYAPIDPVLAGFKLAWHVERLGTAFTASGILTGAAGTTVPAVTTLLTTNNWRSNNATALAVNIDLGVMTLTTLD